MKELMDWQLVKDRRDVSKFLFPPAQKNTFWFLLFGKKQKNQNVTEYFWVPQTSN
jgi:hypothetical protein